MMHGVLACPVVILIGLLYRGSYTQPWMELYPPGVPRQQPLPTKLTNVIPLYGVALSQLLHHYRRLIPASLPNIHIRT